MSPFMLAFLSCSIFFVVAAGNEQHSSVVFTTLGRSSYGFDIYSLPLSTQLTASNEQLLTDGNSVNFNGYFPLPSSLSLLPDYTSTQIPSPIHLVYVTERNGSSHIFLDSLYFDFPDRSGSRSILDGTEIGSTHLKFERVQVPLVGVGKSSADVSMKDRPTLVGDYLVYVSTHEDSGVPRTSWAAVYSRHLKTGLTQRLTPHGVVDFSPAVSPSGEWTAVASYGGKRWDGEVQELGTDIYIFLTRDGSNRIKVVEHGGWPSWVDDSTFYFHRKCKDGWWSVFQATIPKKTNLSVDSVFTRRVTQPGLHAFTPAASVSNKSYIAVATRRPESEFRHIELFDIVSKQFTEITRPIAPNAHHLNPFLSPDSGRIGYHRCRGARNGPTGTDLVLENLKTSMSNVSLFRFDGSFPSFSPDGSRIAYVDFPGVYVINSDGSGLLKVFESLAFSTSWNPRGNVVYTSAGPDFASVSTDVHIIGIKIDDEPLSYKYLTTRGNNAFPSASPDGKWVVFRSGRSGHKNLYIMDSLKGEKGSLYRLTEGPWSDTMCNWSPVGDWIAFSSDRENPGSGGFDLFMIRPNGTGLHKVFKNGFGGRSNHPSFSPDGKYIVFTSDYAGVSAEPISNPHAYQPYGDIFIIKSDGSELKRMTHNSYENGTPTWGPKFIKAADVKWPADEGSQCSFDDCHWLKINSTNVHKNDTTSSYISVKPMCARVLNPHQTNPVFHVDV